MKISYKVTLENPIKSVLKATNDLSSSGSFIIKRGNKGISIAGSYVDEQVEVKAYSESFLGEDYSLNEKSQLQLGIEDYQTTDVMDVFNIFQKHIDSPEFEKIRNSLKLSRSLKIDKFVEKSSDVILVKIDSAGLIQKVNGYVKPFSNQIVLGETLAPTTILGYFLTSKPLKISTNNSLFISNNELLKLPYGFCKLKNTLSVKHTNNLISKGDYSEFYSAVSDNLSFSSYLLVDGVKSSVYKIQENEKILIETSEEYSELVFDYTTNNITLIYEVTPSSDPVPVLALVGKDVGLTSDGDRSVYDELLGADKEFLKKYVRKEYSIILKTKNNEYTIINPEVLRILTTTSEFEGKILKI